MGHDLQMKNFAWKGMSGVGGYVQDFDHLFKSLDMQADDEPQYPYPVYDSPSSEFESVLSSKEWVSDVNNEHL